MRRGIAGSKTVRQPGDAPRYKLAIEVAGRQFDQALEKYKLDVQFSVRGHLPVAIGYS